MLLFKSKLINNHFHLVDRDQETNITNRTDYLQQLLFLFWTINGMSWIDQYVKYELVHLVLSFISISDLAILIKTENEICNKRGRFSRTQHQFCYKLEFTNDLFDLNILYHNLLKQRTSCAVSCISNSSLYIFKRKIIKSWNYKSTYIYLDTNFVTFYDII